MDYQLIERIDLACYLVKQGLRTIARYINENALLGISTNRAAHMGCEEP